MPQLQSTFSIGASSVPFGALVQGYTDKAGAVRELSCGVHFGQALDWDTFRGMVNWDFQVIPMPWGFTVEVLIKGGPGIGVLTIPGLSTPSFNAYLVEATITTTLPNGHKIGNARFIIVTPLP